MAWNRRRQKELKYGVQWEEHRLLGGSCSCCGSGFRLLQVRNHCRKCGRIICSDCQHSEQMEVPGSANKKIVCKNCAVDMSQESSKLQLLAEFTGEIQGQCMCCGDDIVDKFLTLQNGKIHAGCFVCCVDMEPILNGYVEHEGDLYCEEHYVEYFCEPCGGCGQRIRTPDAIEAMGSFWHVDCFVCARCSQPLSDTPERSNSGEAMPFNFYFFNGAIFCAKDYLEHMADKCSGCGFHVDSALEVLGHTWHPECFVCSECKEPLIHMSDATFYVYNGRPLCARDREALMVLNEEEEKAQLRAAPMPSPKQFAPYNAPLASERGACISRGIAKALECAGRSPAASSSRIGDVSFKSHRQLNFPKSDECTHPFRFEVFAPEVFQDLRKNGFGVAEEEYRCSLALRPLTGGDQGEGKSGNLFFFSWDHRYIVKTVDPEEAPFFQKCLKGYYRHMTTQGRPSKTATSTRSLLPRFMGYYTLKMQQEPPIRLVVLANVFPPHLDLKEKYDLKGVMGQNRFVSEEQQSGGVSVLKDRNFVGRSLQIGPDSKTKLIEQLRCDVKFLEDHDRIDYSLLLGVASVHAVSQEPQQWPNPDCHGLSSVGCPKVSASGSHGPAPPPTGSYGNLAPPTGSHGSNLVPPGGSHGYPASLQPISMSSVRCSSPRLAAEASPRVRSESSMKLASPRATGYAAVQVASPRASGGNHCQKNAPESTGSFASGELQPHPSAGHPLSPPGEPTASESSSPVSQAGSRRAGGSNRSPCSSPGDGEVYFMGIIDILEEYTMKKALEGAAKTIKWQATHFTRKATLANNSNAVSACSASHYAQRLLDFLDSKIE